MRVMMLRIHEVRQMSLDKKELEESLEARKELLMMHIFQVMYSGCLLLVESLATQYGE